MIFLARRIIKIKELDGLSFNLIIEPEIMILEFKKDGIMIAEKIGSNWETMFLAHTNMKEQGWLK